MGNYQKKREFLFVIFTTIVFRQHINSVFSIAICCNSSNVSDAHKVHVQVTFLNLTSFCHE
jgi:hypothetical protein